MINFKHKSTDYLSANQGISQETNPTLLTKKIRFPGFTQHAINGD